MSTDSAASTNGHPAPDSRDAGLQPNWGVFTRYAVIAVVAGFGLWIGAGIANVMTAEPTERYDAAKRFALSYLSGYIYWFSLPLGATALIMISYLTKTSWGLLLRRPFEAAMRTWPLFLLLFIPLLVVVFIKDGSPYWWSAPEKTPIQEILIFPGGAHTADKREQTEKVGITMINRTVEYEREARSKAILDFLSDRSYVIVSCVLFAIWITMILLLLKWGRDASDETNTARLVDAALEKLKNFSGPGIIIYALSTTVGATLWVMSLEPAWSSTMFPVIYAVNQFLTCFAFNLAVFLFIAGKPPFVSLMRPKFQLDMGTLMLVFTLFWSYTSFSQFMLVWIGNLPEEIPFYLKRSAGGWWYVSACLIALHFALPFLLLLFRDVKLHPERLRTVAICLCCICAVDVVWWIEPCEPNKTYFPFYLLDIGSIIGFGGLFVLFWIWNLKQRPLFPASQAFLLPEGHHHGHH